MRGKPVMGRMALAGVLALGFAALWGMAGAWLAESGLFGVREPMADEQLGALDGRPVVGRYTYPPGEWRYRDLEGRPVEPARGRQSPLSYPLPLAGRPPKPGLTGPDWRQRLRRFDLAGPPAEVWYLVTDGRAEGSAWFAGYDAETRRPLGVLGQGGMREGEATVGPPAGEGVPIAGAVDVMSGHVFAAVGPQMTPQAGLAQAAFGAGGPRGSLAAWDVYLLGRDARLYHADLRGRTVTLTRAEPDTRSAGVTARWDEAGREAFITLVARSDDAVRVLDAAGKELAHYPIPEMLRGGDLGFVETGAGGALMVDYTGRAGPENEITVARVFAVRPDGAARWQDVQLARASSAAEWRTWQAGGVLVPSPVLYGLVLAGRVLERSGGAVVWRVLAESWLPLGTALAAGVVLAVPCWRRQGRYGAVGAARWGWPVFVLLLGLPGWVGYRYGRRWPVLARCPMCGQEAPRDREECVRCRAEFPGPALRGTEVFA